MLEQLKALLSARRKSDILAAAAALAGTFPELAQLSEDMTRAEVEEVIRATIEAHSCDCGAKTKQECQASCDQEQVASGSQAPAYEPPRPIGPRRLPSY